MPCQSLGQSLERRAARNALDLQSGAYARPTDCRALHGLLHNSRRLPDLAVIYLGANGLVEQDGIRRIRGGVIVQSRCSKGDSVLDLHIYLRVTA